MSSVLDVLAVAATGLFAGAALYITMVEHPARMECGPSIALAEFRPSYHRAAMMQASFALVGSLLALIRWWNSGLSGWLVGGLLLGALIPFTLIVILPTNRRLLEVSLDPARPEATILLRRWGRLHAVRTVASLLAFIILLIVAGRG